MTTEFNSLEKGDILSETTYYQVFSKTVNQIEGVGINAKTSQGGDIRIGKGIVEDNLFSANQFKEEKKVNQTELAELLSTTNGVVFEVNFQKQATSSSVKEALSTINAGRIASNSQIESTIGTAFKGESRTLRGYLLSVEALMGRAKVVDLDVKFEGKESDIRLVDLRHINYLIFKQVKYSLKK